VWTPSFDAYLDYSRKAGEWLPNAYGGREDLDAIGFLRQLNEAAYAFDPGIQMFAEESTAWPGVSRPTYMGGLGFGFKWDMGWMHDTLKYMAQDPVHRKYHHNLLTAALSTDSPRTSCLPSPTMSGHGKGPSSAKCPATTGEVANRAFLAYSGAFPARTPLHGHEFGQWGEWTMSPASTGTWPSSSATTDSSASPATQRALSRHAASTDHCARRYEWIDCNDGDQSTLSSVRRTADNRQVLAVVCNFTPVPRPNFRVGVPIPGHWREVLNTDAAIYGGSGQGNLGGVDTVPIPSHDEPQSLLITLPPLAVVVFEADIHRPGGPVRPGGCR